MKGSGERFIREYGKTEWNEKSIGEGVNVSISYRGCTINNTK